MRRAILLFVSLLFSINSLLAQQKDAEYIDFSPDIFNKFDTPIGIAILPFTYKGFQIDVDTKFYNELTSALGKKSSFIITFYKNLDEIKKSWKIKTWDPKNTKLLKRLASELDIKLIVYAVSYDPEGKSFKLRIVNTETGKEEFNRNYFSSSNSNVIDDAVKLFTEKKVVVYKDSEDKATKMGGQKNIKVDASNKDEAPDMNAFIAVEKMPQIIFQVAPVYPVLARRAGIEGTVYVKILVSKEGKALKAIIIKSDSEVFNQASIDAALKFVFTPAIKDKSPVMVWVVVPFKFKLN